MNVYRRAFQISIVMGLIKGCVYGLIPFPIWQDKAIEVILGVFFTIIMIGVVGEYLLFYRPNMNAHSQLLLSQKKIHTQKLEVTLRELGLRRMLQKHWFVAELKKVA